MTFDVAFVLLIASQLVIWYSRTSSNGVQVLSALPGFVVCFVIFRYLCICETCISILGCRVWLLNFWESQPLLDDHVLMSLLRASTRSHGNYISAAGNASTDGD